MAYRLRQMQICKRSEKLKRKKRWGGELKGFNRKGNFDSDKEKIERDGEMAARRRGRRLMVKLMEGSSDEAEEGEGEEEEEEEKEEEESENFSAGEVRLFSFSLRFGAW